MVKKLTTTKSASEFTLLQIAFLRIQMLIITNFGSGHRQHFGRNPTQKKCTAFSSHCKQSKPSVNVENVKINRKILEALYFYQNNNVTYDASNVIREVCKREKKYFELDLKSILVVDLIRIFWETPTNISCFK